MRTNQIYTAYVSWGSDGKRRPVLIVEDKNKNVAEKILWRFINAFRPS